MDWKRKNRCSDYVHDVRSCISPRPGLLDRTTKKCTDHCKCYRSTCRPHVHTCTCMSILQTNTGIYTYVHWKCLFKHYTGCMKHMYYITILKCKTKIVVLDDPL